MQGKGPTQKALETPRAAALAGIAFALLLAAAIILIRMGIPQGADAVNAQGFTDSQQRGAVQTALSLLPFAGIFFLWFMGAVRAHVGEVEDKFLGTVFLGSGLVFTATMFVAAAAASAVLAVTHSSGSTPTLASWDFGRHFAHTMMTSYATRMAAVFVSSLSVLGKRLGVLPRWLTALGSLTALALLFVSPSLPLTDLVFPAWSLVLSLYILVVSGHNRTHPAAAS
ncbi:hypothetical protein LK07_03985 [Streptomyces pluripotens]|uniref:DUF4386 domain-containing protein n=1 Tax=Streptomyces pluripotens TaxID=1355015 RepID=A0A221NTM2_9ACTN|nr:MULTISPECIES: hypothetical protein [Streptomyces]ARP69069.1 hypothetical protein LK06_002895 [Streptomyces pluripotens]ASN23329.1 hypothetical protein LK07_03985 [Streptomyces pluripotens]KIE25602.1 hypothetical protein LK08_17910 [Streptomyces sp. MUSC 125]MCH0558977.1 hypothetical protein [Streptomyces sp. MUM 16J]